MVKYGKQKSAGCTGVLGKIIGKTIAKTVIAIIIVLALVYAVISLAIPQVLATAFERVGMYGAAVSYARLRYAYTSNVDDLNRVAVDSILGGKNSNIIKFCTMLTENEDFDDYIASMEDGETQRQYIYSGLTVAYYTDGDTDSAVSCAEEALDIDYFPAPNAIGSLTIRLADANDVSTAGVIYTFLQENDKNNTSFSGNSEKYYNAVIGVLEELLNVQT